MLYVLGVHENDVVLIDDTGTQTQTIDLIFDLCHQKFRRIIKNAHVLVLPWYAKDMPSQHLMD